MDFIEFAKDIAPIASVVASLITVIFIPALRVLYQINTKIDLMHAKMNAHENLDEVRFRAFEQRMNEIKEG